jgi:hypothetical protein
MEFKDCFGEILFVGTSFDDDEGLDIESYYDGPLYFNKEQITKLRDHLNKILELGAEDANRSA